MAEGWEQRYLDTATLLANYCAMPVYQMNMGKKAPKVDELLPKRANAKTRLSTDEIEALKKLAEDD